MPNPVRPQGVDSKWVFDYTEDYRIDSSEVTKFLRAKFGDFDFFVKHVGDQYQFWVPRALKDAEREEFDEKRDR